MAYFSNGTEGMDFEMRFCMRCIHGFDPAANEMIPCAVWSLHLQHNYAEANNDKSFLHDLIPANKSTCNMFSPAETTEQMFKPPLKGEVVVLP
jgi:hypothetical protein